ncbi:hypothetical protein NDU88_010031 [Pleurodeles waltl]|uniref:Uncharacterized protein n=1 Tax=Pleurodeles waltl TaxID=8319 RepID=A0AAV7PTR4_PLEWA|nr:hypothetical protein NDU88_010031 [Pleurodeles waltl]
MEFSCMFPGGAGADPEDTVSGKSPARREQPGARTHMSRREKRGARQKDVQSTEASGFPPGPGPTRLDG